MKHLTLTERVEYAKELISAVTVLAASLSMRKPIYVQVVSTFIDIGSWKDLYFSNGILSIVLLANIIYLLVRVNKSYGSGQGQLLRIHHAYSFILALWLLLSIVALLLPRNLFTDILHHVLYAGHASRGSDWKPILLAFAITAAKIGLMFTYFFERSCGFCPLFFPAPQSSYVDFLFAVMYGGFLFVSLKKWPFQTVRGWIGFLLGIYLSLSVCTFLIIQGIDFGYCLTSLVVLVYNLLFVHMIYSSFTRDTQDVVDVRIHKGTLDRETDPLLYYTNQLKGSNASPGVKLIDFEELKFGPKIGVGGYGEVFKGRWNRLDVAIKRIFKKTTAEGDVDEFLKEIKVMSQLMHPNIVLLLGACVSSTGLYIITEYMAKGSLYSILHPGNQSKKDKELIVKPSFEQRLKILLDSARGMLYLHSMKPPIIHRDLKTQNVLVDEFWRGKLCDFGLSRIKASETMSRLGTIQYSAPEVLRGERYTEKADIFSFGILVWETFTERVPYDGWAPLKIASDVAYRLRRPELPSTLMTEVSALINICWHEDPNSRPPFEDIVTSVENAIIEVQVETYEDEDESFEANRVGSIQYPTSKRT